MFNPAKTASAIGEGRDPGNSLVKSVEPPEDGTERKEKRKEREGQKYLMRNKTDTKYANGRVCIIR